MAPGNALSKFSARDWPASAGRIKGWLALSQFQLASYVGKRDSWPGVRRGAATLRKQSTDKSLLRAPPHYEKSLHVIADEKSFVGGHNDKTLTC